MKKCIYCSKEIKDDAIKCRYCGKFIEENSNVEENGNFGKISNIQKIRKLNKNINIKLSIQHINIILVIMLFILGFIVLYLFILGNNYDNSSITSLKIKDQEKLLKSIVKIEYKKGTDDNRIGSGVMFSKDGLLLTNNHVIEDDETGKSIEDITVCILDNIGILPNCNYKGDLIIRNPGLDLAIIKIRDYNSINYINIFNNNTINTSIFGKFINVYGYPFLGGDKITMTKGIVSGFDNQNNIKTDAEINGGNSGGGAFILNDFIGITTYIIEKNSGKIGYIIPKNKIISWFYSMTKNNFDIKYISSNFINENLIFKGDNILTESSFNTPYHKDFEQRKKERYNELNDECIKTYGINSYFKSEFSKNGEYLCDCKEGYEFGIGSEEECILKN